MKDFSFLDITADLFGFFFKCCNAEERNQLLSLLFEVSSLCVCSLSGSSGFKARGKMFEVKSTSGNLLFSADEQEVVVGAERLRVMGEWPSVRIQSLITSKH